MLGIRDLGRIDLRLGDDGAIHFLEINALPSLEPGAGIYAAAALEGLHADAVLGAVIESATRALRHRRAARRAAAARRRDRAAQGRLHLQREAGRRRIPSGEQDEEAEYDSPKTLQAIREAIAS